MIKPCGHRVLVKPIPTESKTASGIIMPDSVKEKGQRDQQKGILSVSEAWLRHSTGTTRIETLGGNRRLGSVQPLRRQDRV